MSGTLSHAPAAAARTKASPFATQTHHEVALAGVTPKVCESIGEHAALQHAAQLFLGELGNAVAVVRLGSVEERGQVLRQHLE
jgi:hypothetical protein